MIGRDHAAGAGHVLHYNVWEARDMFAHVARVGAGEDVVGVAGQIADDDANGFALVERRRLRRRWFKVQRVQEFGPEKVPSESD
jgi:hypothetical protein